MLIIDEAFGWSCANGQIEVAKLLLENGVNIHADNDFAFLLSCLNGHIDVAKFLLKKGANIHADNDYAFRWSCRNWHIKVAKLLCEQCEEYSVVIKKNKILKYFLNNNAMNIEFGLLKL